MKYSQLLQKRSQSLSLQENSLRFLCKDKATQADVGICMYILGFSGKFKHKQKYSQVHSKHSVILAYLQPWHIQYQKHIQSRAILRALTYSEPWYIRSPGIFRTLFYSEVWYIQNPGIFKTLVYSETWYIQNPDIFRTLLNIFDGAFSQKQLTAVIIFITSVCQVRYFVKKKMILLINCTPEVFT